MAEFVFMEHSGLDGRVIKVPESAIPIHAASGWQLVEGDQAKSAEKKYDSAEAKALEPTAEEGAVDSAKSVVRRPAASKES